MKQAQGKRGRPEHAPDKRSRKVVSELVSAGVDQATIARSLGIAASTLHRHYRGEIDTATAFAVTKLAGALYQRALGMADGPAVTAAIFILKCRGGWSDRPAAPPGAGAAPAVPVDAVDMWGGE